MQSLIQIFKVNELRKGVKDGREWQMQDAECALLDQEGVIQQIGVLRIPKDLRDQVKPGIYSGSFALKPDLRSRIIEAVLTGLTAVPDGAIRRIQPQPAK